MRLSKRLQEIANLVEQEDLIADVGCDHAYLSIYLAQNKLCKKIIATEVVKGPYNIALNNIKNNKLENNISLYLTDGLSNINDPINTIIIAGMGANTIIKILKEYKYINNINKMIIQSNNDWELLRRFLNSLGFYIEKEIYVNEKNKDYITLLAYRLNKKNTEKELMIGVYESKSHKLYSNQLNKLKNILKEINNPNDSNYKKIEEKIILLESYIN